MMAGEMKSSREELRVTMPKALFEAFEQNPRIVILKYPAGLIPIDLELLKNAEFVKTLTADPDVQKNYEVVLVAR